MRRRIEGITLECVMGDIARQADVEAVVNAANAGLRPGGGVAGALHRAAGPGLEEECRPLAPIRPGQAVITGAAAGVAFRAVLDELPRLESVRCIRFVLRDDHALAVHEEALRRALEASLTGYL